MSIYRLMIILFTIFFVPTGSAATIGNLYHITFNWKTEQITSAYYEMTSHIFDSMSKEPAYLYSKYGDLSGVYIWLPSSDAYAKLEKIISNSNSKYFDPEIDHDPTLRTLLDKIFVDIDSGKINFSCEVLIPKFFSSADEVMQYITKIQYYILRRGYLISMDFMGKTPKKFDIKFNFLADCASKKAIVKDLLDVVSRDHTTRRQLF